MSNKSFICSEKKNEMQIIVPFLEAHVSCKRRYVNTAVFELCLHVRKEYHTTRVHTS